MCNLANYVCSKGIMLGDVIHGFAAHSETGVRVALGAPAPPVIADIFRRPLRQVARGVVAGCSLFAGVTFARRGSGVAMARPAAYGIAVMGVCVLACIGPALRALRMDPDEALREDAQALP